MTQTITEKHLTNALRAHGLDASDPTVLETIRQEYEYAARHYQPGETEPRGGVTMHLVEQAAANTARRLGAHDPLSRGVPDTRDLRQRYLDALPPAQREQAHAWMNGGRESPEEQARQQNVLRAEFLAKVRGQAVNYQKGNQLDDYAYNRIAREFKRQGLKDISITREDIGQTDHKLDEYMQTRPEVQSGAYNPKPWTLHFAGENDPEPPQD